MVMQIPIAKLDYIPSQSSVSCQGKYTATTLLKASSKIFNSFEDKGRLTGRINFAGGFTGKSRWDLTCLVNTLSQEKDNKLF